MSYAMRKFKMSPIENLLWRKDRILTVEDMYRLSEIADNAFFRRRYEQERQKPNRRKWPKFTKERIYEDCCHPEGFNKKILVPKRPEYKPMTAEEYAHEFQYVAAHGITDYSNPIAVIVRAGSE